MVTNNSQARIASASARPRKLRSALGRASARHIALLLGGVAMVYPLLWMLGASFKSEREIFGTLSPIPTAFAWANYPDGWTATDPGFQVYFVNSVIIAGLSVIANVLACSVTAYAFARLDFRFRRTCFAIMLGSIMLPSHAMLIPQYILFFNMGWVNTFLPLVVPKLLATDAFFVFLMVQFIRNLPRSLDEAAMLDGCGKARIFTLIIFPLLRPALATTAVFTFIWTYNDFFAQLIYLTLPISETVPVALRRFVDMSGSSSYGQLMAMSVLSLVPTLIVFAIAQKRIVEGIATTGIKG